MSKSIANMSIKMGTTIIAKQGIKYFTKTAIGGAVVGTTLGAGVVTIAPIIVTIGISFVVDKIID